MTDLAIDPVDRLELARNYADATYLVEGAEISQARAQAHALIAIAEYLGRIANALESNPLLPLAAGWHYDGPDWGQLRTTVGSSEIISDVNDSGPARA